MLMDMERGRDATELFEGKDFQQMRNNQIVNPDAMHRGGAHGEQSWGAREAAQEL